MSKVVLCGTDREGYLTPYRVGEDKAERERRCIPTSQKAGYEKSQVTSLTT